MKLKRVDTGSDAGRQAAFAAKALLVGTLIAGCTPDVHINNKFYDPNASDAGCTSVTNCAKQAFSLRPNGSKAGPDRVALDGWTVRLVEISDSGSTKAAKLEFESCGQKAESAFLPKTVATITAGRDSFSVSLDSIEYDAAGLMVYVSVAPACKNDAGAKKSDAKKG
ncbi:MAG: hypothetical protein AB1529_06705 [Candidatus Micrarchaeota archaeon]